MDYYSLWSLAIPCVWLSSLSGVQSSDSFFWWWCNSVEHCKTFWHTSASDYKLNWLKLYSLDMFSRDIQRHSADFPKEIFTSQFGCHSQERIGLINQDVCEQIYSYIICRTIITRYLNSLLHILLMLLSVCIRTNANFDLIGFKWIFMNYCRLL